MRRKNITYDRVLKYDSVIILKIEGTAKRKLRKFMKEDKETGISTLLRKLIYKYIEEREKHES